jgi:hypothetical protein
MQGTQMSKTLRLLMINQYAATDEEKVSSVNGIDFFPCLQEL